MSTVAEPIAEPIPLRMDAHGIYYVGDTRVTLDTVICAFNTGDSAEEIVLHYPVLRLNDVYLVLGYYLQHKADLDAYLIKREAQRTTLQASIESSPLGAIRNTLLVRQSQQNGNA